MNIVAADIGGTNSRLAWAEVQAGRAVRQHTNCYTNREWSGFEAILRAFLGELPPGAGIDRMTLALPAPIEGDRIALTNIDWLIDAPALRAAFAPRRLDLVNDFQAHATGVLYLPATDLQVLQAGAPDPAGAAVVAGPGTGLGMAWFATRSEATGPRASQGGHIDFAPRNPDQDRLLDALRARHGHVSYERLLSGPGLAALDAILGDRPERRPEAVSAAAQRGEADACRSLATFADVLGAYAGNLAMLFAPGGGIYLGGGLCPRLAPLLDGDRILAAFLDKGRMREFNERIPLYMVTRDGAGLEGALRLAQHSLGQSSINDD